MSAALSRCVCRVLSRHTATSSLLSGGHPHAVTVSPWFAPVMTLKTSAPLRAEPKKKKKVDPKREQIMRDRLKKKLRKLEKVPPQYIPVEDFITPISCMDETRQRLTPRLSFDEGERRALLLKEWSRYKQEQYMAEMKAIEDALKAQSEALDELRLESEELYQAALKPDPHLFPFSQEGPAFTPAKSTHEAPDGKYNDVTKVHTQ